MTATRPKGHVSEADDYCDQCGARLSPTPAAIPADPPGVTNLVSATAAAGACPACGMANAGGDRFCESCGADLHADPPLPVRQKGSDWWVTSSCDREYFERVERPDKDFPVVHLNRNFHLVGDRLVIGRRNMSRGIEPDIDLSAQPVDAGVSHQHAILLRQPQGGWAILDPGSTNGVFLNNAGDPLPVNQLTPLDDGDRIHLGAWTTLTIRNSNPEGSRSAM